MNAFNIFNTTESPLNHTKPGKPDIGRLCEISQDLFVLPSLQRPAVHAPVKPRKLPPGEDLLVSG